MPARRFHDAAVMFDALKLRVPSACPSCRTAGGIAIKTDVARGTASLTWVCSACRAEWAVTDGDNQAIPERRQGARDRRRSSRTDRRRKESH
jgi:hypothetical protein